MAIHHLVRRGVEMASDHIKDEDIHVSAWLLALGAFTSLALMLLMWAVSLSMLHYSQIGLIILIILIILINRLTTPTAPSLQPLQPSKTPTPISTSVWIPTSIPTNPPSL